jgi:monothiol glutaredoxin
MPAPDPIIADRIRGELTANDIVLFMKGVPVFPQCGASAQAVQILNILGVTFKSIDVLTDASIRQGIKDYGDWPTVPQLYVKGEFVGGADIMREMLATGELQELLAARGIAFEPYLKSA